MIGNVLRLAWQLLAGIGAGEILDKFAADKLPAYPAGGINSGFKDESGKFNIPKVVWFVGAGIAVTLALKFIGKKFNIKILK